MPSCSPWRHSIPTGNSSHVMTASGLSTPQPANPKTTGHHMPLTSTASSPSRHHHTSTPSASSLALPPACSQLTLMAMAQPPPSAKSLVTTTLTSPQPSHGLLAAQTAGSLPIACPLTTGRTFATAAPGSATATPSLNSAGQVISPSSPAHTQTPTATTGYQDAHLKISTSLMHPTGF